MCFVFLDAHGLVSKHIASKEHVIPDIKSCTEGAHAQGQPTH